MRISEQNTYLNFLRDLRSSQQHLQDVQLRLSSGKKVVRPSDNPQAASDIVRLSGEKAEAEQFMTNLELGRSRLDAAERTVDSVERMVERVRNLGLLSMGALPDTDAYVAEITGLREQLVNAANTAFQGRYLFGGTVLDQPPYTTEADGTVTYGGTSSGMTLQIGRNSTIETQIPGNEIFTGNVDVFAAISDLVTAIEAGDRTAIDTQVRQLEQVSGVLSTARTRIGLEINHADSVESDLNSGKIVRERRLESLQTADPAETITELTQAETRLQATLAVGARLSQLSLLDYLP